MRILAYLAVAVVVFLVVVWTQQRRLLYFPAQDPGSPPPGWVEVSIPGPGGHDLATWQRVAGASAGAPMIVLFPGNGGNRAGRIPTGDALAERGFAVVLVDYRGYGGNPGAPTEAGLAEDARRVVEFLARNHDRPIVYFGESLGAAVATGLAIDTPPDALILVSPFTALADVGRFHYPWAPSFLLRESYPSLARFDSGALSAIPVLVVAGSADTVIPVAQSMAIADAAGAEWYEVPGVDHNDPAIRSSPEMIDTVADFLGRVIGRESG